MSEKHGLTHHRLHPIWATMKQRCNDPNATSYGIYGGRGISMCKEWQESFIAFYGWAMKHGYKENLTIDRIDTNGNYEPSNCRWATRTQQANNLRNNRWFTYKGTITDTLPNFCRSLGLPYGTISIRLYRGWGINKALDTEIAGKCGRHF